MRHIYDTQVSRRTQLLENETCFFYYYNHFRDCMVRMTSLRMSNGITAAKIVHWPLNTPRAIFSIKILIVLIFLVPIGYLQTTGCYVALPCSASSCDICRHIFQYQNKPTVSWGWRFYFITTSLAWSGMPMLSLLLFQCTLNKTCLSICYIYKDRYTGS